MAHGLAKFSAQDLIERAQSAASLIDASLEPREDLSADALVEILKIALENQITIAETLGLIKQEFDKFEEGINKIL